MEKRSKDALRRYKKSRQQAESSSDSSSSSDSDSSGSSYSSSESERHRRKKARQAQAGTSRRSSSTSADERRKREKREHCQKKLEAKRNHLKRKLKEAKLKKRAAEAAAALSGHSHRTLSPATQLKLKKLAERKHQRAASKERREREREKHRAAARDREREHHRGGGSRSPTKITKIRIHQDVKRQKSPPRMHHAMMSREKIIIQTRTRERTPSPTVERQRHEHKMRHDEMARERERRDRERERAEREAARDKERAEALARCQERQRERERLAREKLRREEEEKKYGLGVDRGERLLPRPAERDLAIAASRGYTSRERSLEAVERARHLSKRDLEVYEREREYIEAERRGLLEREDLRRERDYLTVRRRELSPVGEHYSSRIRDPRDLYTEEERERVYNRGYIDDARHPRERDAWPRDPRDRETHELRDPREVRDPRDVRDPREFRELEHDLIYPDERERLIRNRERAREEWKPDWEVGRDHEWNDAPPTTGRGGFIGGPKRGAGVGGGNTSTGPPKILAREQRAPSEPDWDTDEVQKGPGASAAKIDTPNVRDVPNFGSNAVQRDTWADHDHHDPPAPREKATTGRSELVDRRWQNDWRDEEEAPTRGTGNASSSVHHHRSERGGRNFRRGGGATGLDHGDRNVQGLRPHPPPLMTLPVQPPATSFHGGNPRFPNKRNMTYTNPNLIKKQQAALAAAKAAAQASAVAAASTAVAAAKAAAQSAANATTNPSILGQASGIRQQLGHIVNEEKPEVGEILQEKGDFNKLESISVVKNDNLISNNPIALVDEKPGGELSEISDSDDDILNKTEKKSKTETDESVVDPLNRADVVSEQDEATRSNEDAAPVEDKTEDDEMLDFEEISDGELEEDARNKGVGDALGVDWASLIAETKRHAENAAPNVSEQPTTAKQKWQPHRLILDIGISISMAGEDYAKRILNESKQKLAEEFGEARKSDVKDEIASTVGEDSQAIADTDENTNDTTTEKKTSVNTVPQKALEELDDASFNVDRLHPIACIQVAERLRRLKSQKLISNACGAHSRALSARQDLKLRRQLCNLPAQDNNLERPGRISAKIKAMALSAFQRALEVK